MLRALCGLCLVSLLVGCTPEKSKDSNSAATGGTTAPIGGPTGIAGNGGSPAGGAMSGGTQTPAGGEMAGGAPSGGMAAMMPMPKTPIDERCPDAQAGEHLLVLFKDRVTPIGFEISVWTTCAHF